MSSEEIKFRKLVTVSRTTPVTEMSAAMEEEGVRKVVVTENDEPVGIVTERDLKRCVYGRSPTKKKVKDLLSEKVPA